MRSQSSEKIYIFKEFQTTKKTITCSHFETRLNTEGQKPKVWRGTEKVWLKIMIACVQGTLVEGERAIQTGREGTWLGSSVLKLH